MFSRRMFVSAVAVGAAAVAIVAGSVPAYALTTVTVTASSTPSGTSVAVTATSTSTLVWKDATTGFTFSCTSSSLSGTTRAGANSPSNMAQINGGAGQIAFNSCTTLGYPFMISGVGTATWTLAATGITASDTTPIRITGVNLIISDTSCSFNVSGSVAGSLVNGSPSKIIIPIATASTSNLVVSNVVLQPYRNRCVWGFSAGDKISLSATYNIAATNSAYNPVTATAS